jgi:molecular chaperone GrpE
VPEKDDKKSPKKKSEGKTSGRYELSDKDIAEADEDILNSLQDIAGHLDEYPEDEDDEMTLDPAEAFAEEDQPPTSPENTVTPPGKSAEQAQADETSDSAMSRLVDESILQAPNVHLIVEKQLRGKDEEIERLRRELGLATEEARESRQRLLRMKADFENFKKRQWRDLEDNLEKSRRELVAQFLLILDNLERGVETFRESENRESLLEGLGLIVQQFLKVLADNEVTPIKALGQPFDPHFHQAMETMVTKEQPPNTVLMEFQKGYLMKGRVIRPTVVVVAKEPAVPAEQPEASTATEKTPPDTKETEPAGKILENGPGSEDTSQTEPLAKDTAREVPEQTKQAAEGEEPASGAEPTTKSEDGGNDGAEDESPTTQ